MKSNDYVAWRAWSAALGDRHKPGPWNDPVLRPCENYLYAFSSVVDYGDPAWYVDLEVFGYDFLKGIGRSNTSPPSAEARDAGYEGASDGAARKDWKRSARVTVDVRAALGSPRICGALLALGALCTAGTSLTDLCPMRPVLAYGSTAVLVATAVGVLRGWPGARMAARIACWLGVFLFAMLIVPDREDAEFTGSYGYHTLCGVLAGYFLLCAICMGFAPPKSSVAV
jgi:hypothetical protein